MPCFLRCWGNGNEWSDDSGGGGQDSTEDKLVLPYLVVSMEMRVRVFNESRVGLLAYDIIYKVISN